MTTSSTTTSLAAKRILLIEDEPDLRRVVQACLERTARWTVSTAASGQEGLFKAATDKPDAIVLDIMTPNMDGYSVLDALLANPETLSIPVVVLTASPDSPQLYHSEALRVNGIMAESFNPLMLHQVIAAALGWELNTQ